MKTPLLKTSLLAATLLMALPFVSCKKENTTTDTEEVADDQNDEKFDDTDKEDDSEFVVKAAEINMDEIALGKLAQTKGTAASVKDLGKMMVAEHTKALDELKAMAMAKNISIPESPTEDSKETLTKFQEKETADFDKDYADKMVEGHKDAISAFEKAATDAADADVRNWATKMLPGLRLHLQHAEEVRDGLK
ncbi:MULTISPECIES: DUF4142 domain-containing protein [unclassified Flavobacterium]|uniref:DUF4142 domain-containing protein n=1 Tax=unclassified Flavobacterium TaxID=196869 RepID=UPI001F140CD8|nr:MULTISPECIES: DUF4142 domain-containing protein [unclassified Flavobacterium]UMY65150.1 DUF4142 domain-containing protein [Flavobacterium sp. HJ-32-4]